MQRIEIDQATDAQLRQFGEVSMGIELEEGLSRDRVIGRIQKAGHTGKFIFVVEEAPLPEASSGPKKPLSKRPRKVNGNPVLGEYGKPEQEVRIMIHSDSGPGGDEPVFVAINGRGMYIPRGEEVWVPEKYLGVLNDAKEEVYPQFSDRPGDMGGLKTPRLVDAYPYAIL